MNIISSINFSSCLFLVVSSFWRIHINDRVGFLFAMSLAAGSLFVGLMNLESKNE